MWTTQNQEEFEKILTNFIKLHGDQYSLGYFQTLLVSMLKDLPKRQQKMEIDYLRRHVHDTWWAK